MVKYLLEHGADPNTVNDTNRSALWRAAFNNHVEVVKLLLESGMYQYSLNNLLLNDPLSMKAQIQSCEIKFLLSPHSMSLPVKRSEVFW